MMSNLISSIVLASFATAEMGKYEPGAARIPSVFGIPQFFTVNETKAFKKTNPLVPDIPFALYDGNLGLEFNGTSFPRLLFRVSEVEKAIVQHVTPLTVGNTTLPALAWIQQKVRFDSYDDFLKVSFTPAELAMPTSDQKTVIDLHDRMFSDSQTMEENFVQSLFSSIPFNGILGFRKLGHGYYPYQEDYDVLVNDFGIDKEEAYEYLNCGLYYLIDTEDIGQVKPRDVGTLDASLSIGAKTLLKRNKVNNLIPLMIKVTMLPSREDDAEPYVRLYSKETSTDSAWRLAMLAARSSFTQWGIIGGHFLPFHITVSAFQQGIYNNLAPEHPLREAISPFLLYSMQWTNFALLNIGQLYGLPYHNTAPRQANFQGVFKTWNSLYEENPFKKQLPSDFLGNRGILQEDFSNKKPWDMMPLADLGEKTEKITNDFVTNIIETLYNSDEDIVNDVQLQAFFQDAKDPQGLNMGNLLPGNPDKISTRVELERILGTYFYLTTTHSFSRLNDFSEGGHTVPFTIAAFSSFDFIKNDDKTTHYDEQQIINHMPPSHLCGGLLQLTYFFLYTTPYDNMGDVDNEYTTGISELYTNGENDAVNASLKEGLLVLQGEIRKIIKGEVGPDRPSKDVEFNLGRIPRNSE
eukprot:Pgem_evm1s10223